MLTSLALSLVGFTFLIFGGELVVKSSSKIATSFGLSPLLVGLTVVAFGTSAPELGVSLMASFQGNEDIALTNVVGSNIFNLAFILGVCALAAPLVVNLQLLKLDIPISIISTLILFIMCQDGVISFIEGMALLLILVGYMIWILRASKKEKKQIELNIKDKKEEISSTFKSRTLNFLIFIIGISVLVGGSKLLVSGASDLALRAGVSEAIIGLTLVAVGTSLPELVSSLIATLRGNTDIAIGNVIGSNIFNILFILGSSSIISQKGISVANNITYYDIPFLLFLSVLSFPFLLSGKKVVKWEGVVFLLLYLGYCFYLILRG